MVYSNKSVFGRDRQSPEVFMTTLKATARDTSINIKELRRTGYVPAIVYGKNLDASISIQIESAYALRLLKGNDIGSQIELSIGDETYNTMIKDMSSHPVTYKLQHLDFQVLTSGEKVSTQAHIHLINKDKTPSESVLQELVSELTYTALPKDLFESIELDIATLEVGDSIHLKDLAIATDERYNFQDDISIELVHLSHAKKIVEEDDTEVLAGAEVPVIGKPAEE